MTEAPAGLPALFPVLDTGTTIDTDGDAWPTAVIDVSGHPEIGDLARVHAVEGIGDIETRASRIERNAEVLVLLGVRITAPVRCAFALAFRLPEHGDVLRAAVTADRLVIATDAPDRSAEQLWLAIDLDGARLAEVAAAT